MTTLEPALQTKIDTVEKRLQSLLSMDTAGYAPLREAARYALDGGGKRLRPVLTLVVNEALGGQDETALDAACAMEYIHNYSLIHDDLPCMDDDDFRRGRPSLHKQYSESVAVLTGDYLLTYAFEVIAQSATLSAQQKVDASRCLAQGSGGVGMIAGQAMDLEAEGQDLSVAQLDAIHLHKTACLIAAAMELGGICAGASSEVRQELHAIGLLLGHAFQIVDDVLDDEQDAQPDNGGVNYVALLGRDESWTAAEKLLQESLAKIAKLPGNTAILADLAERLVHRTV